MTYYGLRSYSTQPQQWGGDPECSHEWQATTRKGVSGGTESKKVQVKGEENFQIVPDSTVGICSKCGAYQGELGAEPTVSMFVSDLVSVFRDARRVLRSDGTLWVNISDSYAGSGGSGGDYNEGGLREGQPRYTGTASKLSDSIKPLDLCGVPFSFALAMRDDGWYWRDTIIWHSNKMPESMGGWRWERCRTKAGNSGRGQARHGNFQNHSGNDVEQDAIWEDCPGCKKCEKNDGYVLRKGSGRCTRAFEYVFMFSKTADYYYDNMAIREEAEYDGRKDKSHKGGVKFNNGGYLQAGEAQSFHGKPHDRWKFENGVATRNKRNVWKISTEQSPTYSVDGEEVAHYAAWPKELV